MQQPESSEPRSDLRLSVVIPLYNSEDTIGRVVRELAGLPIEGGLELVLVNDGSADQTLEVCRGLAAELTLPITILSLSRNFGEHNAVLQGLRHARGRYIVTMDDDGQNPPSEVPKLLAAAEEGEHDVVYGIYRQKRHAPWRNWGSTFANWMSNFVLEKPRDLYLSSFRCLSGFLAAQVSSYGGPFPYIDGLILQATRRIGTVEVEHAERETGSSNYTLRKLVRLWLNMFVNFSVLPLRAATALGFLIGGLGLLATVVVVVEHFLWATPLGWGSLMAGLLIFSGTQLILLGIIGEYVGRTYLTVNGKPQSVVREIRRSGTDKGGCPTRPHS